MIDPVQRLMQLMQGFREYPGRAPGGSGPTGIGRPSSMGGHMIGPPTRQDLEDYGQMIQEQQEYFQLLNPKHKGFDLQYEEAPVNPALTALKGAGMTNPSMARANQASPDWTIPKNPSWTIQKSMLGNPEAEADTSLETHDQFLKRYGR